MKDYLRRTNTTQYGAISKAVGDVAQATANATLASAFNMKQPLASPLCKPVFQVSFSSRALTSKAPRLS